MTSSGFSLIKNFLTERELASLEIISQQFHQSWLTHHADLYKKGAVNSAYLTGGNFLSSDDRLSFKRLDSLFAVRDEMRTNCDTSKPFQVLTHSNRVETTYSVVCVQK